MNGAIHRNPLHLKMTDVKFDKIVSNPPFSLDKWGAELKDDVWKIWNGLPNQEVSIYSTYLVSLNEWNSGIILHTEFVGCKWRKNKKANNENNWLDAV